MTRCTESLRRLHGSPIASPTLSRFFCFFRRHLLRPHLARWTTHMAVPSAKSGRQCWAAWRKHNAKQAEYVICLRPFAHMTYVDFPLVFLFFFLLSARTSSYVALLSNVSSAEEISRIIGSNYERGLLLFRHALTRPGDFVCCIVFVYSVGSYRLSHSLRERLNARAPTASKKDIDRANAMD